MSEEKKEPAMYMYYKKSDKGIKYRKTESSKAPKDWVGSPADIDGYKPGMDIHPE